MKNFIAVFLAFAMAVSFCACGNDSPKAALKARLDAMIAAAKGDTVSESLQENENAAVIAKAMVDNIKYKIGKQKIDGDSATVHVSITGIDVAALMEQAIEQYNIQSSSDNEFSIDEWIAGEIVKEDVPKTTNEADVPLVKTDEGWVIDESGSLEDLANSLTGGYFSAINGVANNLTDETQK